jgi:hypothetical protein
MGLFSSEFNTGMHLKPIVGILEYKPLMPLDCGGWRGNYRVIEL